MAVRKVTAKPKQAAAKERAKARAASEEAKAKEDGEKAAAAINDAIEAAIRAAKAAENHSLSKRACINSKFETIGSVLFPTGLIDVNAPSSEVILDRAIDSLARGGSVQAAITAMSRVSVRLAAVRKLLA